MVLNSPFVTCKIVFSIWLTGFQFEIPKLIWSANRFKLCTPFNIKQDATSTLTRKLHSQRLQHQEAIWGHCYFQRNIPWAIPTKAGIHSWQQLEWLTRKLRGLFRNRSCRRSLHDLSANQFWQQAHLKVRSFFKQ